MGLLQRGIRQHQRRHGIHDRPGARHIAAKVFVALFPKRCREKDDRLPGSYRGQFFEDLPARQVWRQTALQPTVDARDFCVALMFQTSLKRFHFSVK
jgi:hypothetical protein